MNEDEKYNIEQWKSGVRREVARTLVWQPLVMFDEIWHLFEAVLEIRISLPDWWYIAHWKFCQLVHGKMIDD